VSFYPYCPVTQNTLNSPLDHPPTSLKSHRIASSSPTHTCAPCCSVLNVKPPVLFEPLSRSRTPPRVLDQLLHVPSIRSSLFVSLRLVQNPKSNFSWGPDPSYLLITDFDRIVAYLVHALPPRFPTSQQPPPLPSPSRTEPLITLDHLAVPKILGRALPQYLRPLCLGRFDKESFLIDCLFCNLVPGTWLLVLVPAAALRSINSQSLFDLSTHPPRH
jgi:hypothetical protein